MKLLNAAIAISTLTTASLVAPSSSSVAMSETKRLRNIQVYKSDKNGSTAREGHSLNDARLLQFLDISLSLSLSVDSSSLPDTTMTTDAPSSAALTTGAPSSASPTSVASSSATSTSLAPSAAPSMIVSTAKGGVTMAPALSSSSAPSTAAPFATVVETPIVVSSPPSSAAPASSAPSSAAPASSAPSTSAPATTCTFCEGYAVNSDVVITGSEVTCAQVLEYAPSVMTGSDECKNVQLAEAVCCTLDMPSNLADEQSMSYDIMSYGQTEQPTITPIAVGTMAPTPTASVGETALASEPTTPPFVGLLPEVPRSRAMKMSTMGGAWCWIASVMVIAGFFQG